jgi:hypothetical protein
MDEKYQVRSHPAELGAIILSVSLLLSLRLILGRNSDNLHVASMTHAGSSSVIFYEYAKSELASVEPVGAHDLVGLTSDELEMYWRKWAIQQSVQRQVSIASFLLPRSACLHV